MSSPVPSNRRLDFKTVKREYWFMNNSNRNPYVVAVKVVCGRKTLINVYGPFRTMHRAIQWSRKMVPEGTSWAVRPLYPTKPPKVK